MSQAAQLRAFTRRAVLGNGTAERDYVYVDVVRPDGAGLAESNTPYTGVIEAPDRIVAFDLDSLLWARDYRKAAVLAPASVPALFFEDAALSDEAAWTFVETLRDTLVSTEPLIVFDRTQARELAIFGATRISYLTLPALAAASLTEDAGPACVLLIDHLHDPELLGTMRESLQRALPQLQIVTWSTTQGNEPTDTADGARLMSAARRALAHIHIGAGSAARRPRIVDSHAMRKPVVLYQPFERLRDGQDEPAAHEHVEHLRSGLVAFEPATLEASVRRVMQDSAGVAIFLRNGDRVVETLNNAIVVQLREILT